MHLLKMTILWPYSKVFYACTVYQRKNYQNYFTFLNAHLNFIKLSLIVGSSIQGFVNGFKSQTAIFRFMRQAAFLFVLGLRITCLNSNFPHALAEAEDLWVLYLHWRKGTARADIQTFRRPVCCAPAVQVFFPSVKISHLIYNSMRWTE